MTPTRPARLLRSRNTLAIFLTLATACVSTTLAGEWPTFRHDAQRSGVTAETLTFPLRLAWKYVCPQPPSPAWPDTFRLLNRTDFDYAPQPVIVQGIVYFAASDDTVRALDTATGLEKWHFTAGAAVRFAPQIAGGKAYFASDDGYAYCVDAATGKLVWKFRAAPTDERAVGNHRMMSRWPVRTGVLVADGAAYFVAGMWNMEGVFAYAVEADTGKLIWCNDTLGLYNVALVDFPTDDPEKQAVGGHSGEFAANGALGSNPQGNLLMSGDVLVIPNGNSAPTALDRRTGALTIKGAGPRAPSMIDKEKVYGFYRHHEDQLTLTPFALNALPAPRGWGKDVIPQVKIHSAKLGQILDRVKVSAVVRNGKVYARKAYELVLSGNTLFIGDENEVSAQDADTERVLWRAAVNGEARGLAVTDGKLFVTTSAGEVYCYVPAVRGAEVAPIVIDPAAKIRAAAPTQPAAESAAAKLLEQLRKAGMDRGFALVVGDPDGATSTMLAANTQLRVVNAMTDEVAVTALREKLLLQTAFNGNRVHVQTVASLDRLPYAQFFANTVVVAGAAPGVSAKELFRVLRPCGGILAVPGLAVAEGDALLKGTGAAAEEAQILPEVRVLSRAKLPGALDWDSPKRTGVREDQRVKWPLRPLWFGGPGTVQVQSAELGGDFAIANGRYFICGEQSLTAVDAYNGEILWTHTMPRGPAHTTVDGVIYRVANKIEYARGELSSRVIADDNFVYLGFSPAFFPTPVGNNATTKPGTPAAKGESFIQLDARTGEQVKIASPYNLPNFIPLKGQQKWALQVDPRRSGEVVMEPSDRGVLLTLTTKDPLVTRLDAWELFFDFRPVDRRFGLYERGTFRARVVVAQDKNTAPTWSSGSWADEQSATPRAAAAKLSDPTLEVTGTRDTTGTKTVVLLSWAELEKLTGGKPSSFGFAATLNAHDGGRDEPIETRHLFGDWTASALNNGWASVVLDEAAASISPGTRPSIFVDAIKPVGGIGGNGDYVTAAREAPRVHPLTGELEPKMYRRGGCGGLSTSSALRSGSQSIYDFEDDSGMRALGGVKARCSTPQIVALGLLIYSEESGHCECPYPVRSTLVMAPAERRLNEDWAFFFARPPDTYLRQAAINLGAPGDRRDGEGTLWLGYPRIPGDRSMAFPIVAGTTPSVGTNGVWLRTLSAAMQLPLDIECFADVSGKAYEPKEDMAVGSSSWVPIWQPARNQREFGPYRINGDRADVQGTDRPWLYASQYRGIRRAALKLDFLQPVVSAAVEKMPAVNNAMDDPAWKTAPQAKLPFTKSDIFIRHDNENLYIVARRPSVVDRVGKVVRWTKTTSGEDAKIWDDDSFEVFVSDGDAKSVVHLGVSASGARFDALSTDGKKEDPKWNATWKSTVLADQSALTNKPAALPTEPVPVDSTLAPIDPATPRKGVLFAAEQPPLVMEVAIPWKTLEAAGLNRERLSVNFQMNQKDTSGQPVSMPGSTGGGKNPPTSGEALCYLGMTGRELCKNFAPLGLGGAPRTDTRPFTIRLHFAELDDVKVGQRVFNVKIGDQVVLKDFDVVKEAGGTRKALVKEFKSVRVGPSLSIEFIPVSKELKKENVPILSAIEVFDERSRAMVAK